MLKRFPAMLRFSVAKVCIGLRLVLLAVAVATSITAQNLQLDPTFDMDGKLTVAFGSKGQRTSHAVSVYAQPSGRIVAQGIHVTGGTQGTAACGITQSGALDSGFGTGGRIVQMDETLVREIEPLPNGQYLRLAFLNFASSSSLERFNADGTLDSSFSADLNIGTFTSPYKLAVRPDGKIVVLLTEFNVGEQPWLLRLNANGTRDTTFGTNGASPINLRRLGSAAIANLHVLPDNRILLGGYASSLGGPQGGNIAWAALLDENGYFDRRFGIQGVFRMVFANSMAVTDSLVQADGKIILVGFARPAMRAHLLLIRLTTRGRRDTSFGQNGVVIAPSVAPESYDLAQTGQIMNDGRIIVAGSHAATIFDRADFLIARFSSTGVMESHAVTRFTPDFDAAAFDVFIQSDGKPIVAGYTRNPDSMANGNVFAIARYTQ